ncbi:MAG: metallophosphoesterase, partial [Clostridia bacterium]|nr:metallophosphoesterase [Clostridia bacterium]
KEIKKIAPCYYVTGNHEARVGSEYAVLKDGMIREGVVILENDVLTVGCENAYIEVIGLEDPTFSVSGSTETEAEVVADKLRKLTGSEKDFTLLLSHKPEFFDIYVENGIDLVLSGHTHGGQFIIPFIGGLIAPGQGFFPEFDSGFFEKEGTKMIVSRGLGNSIIPLRVNNRPEVILIELHCGY